MDKRCGSSWHVIVGEGFGFEITHEMRNLLHMFFGGNVVHVSRFFLLLWLLTTLNLGNLGLESIVKFQVVFIIEVNNKPFFGSGKAMIE